MLYVWCHKKYASVLAYNETAKKILQSYCCPYSVVITVAIASVTFPKGVGQYLATNVDSVRQLQLLFNNNSWTEDNINGTEGFLSWTSNSEHVLLCLFGYCAFTVKKSLSLRYGLCWTIR